MSWSTDFIKYSDDIPKLRCDRSIAMQWITQLCIVEISVRCLLFIAVLMKIHSHCATS